jgi:hypothetical protein
MVGRYPELWNSDDGQVVCVVQAPISSHDSQNGATSTPPAPHSKSDAECSQSHEALRTIAGLYLRADVGAIKGVIEHFRLADMLTKYLLSQYKQSSTIAGLGLEMSRAFVADACCDVRSSNNASEASKVPHNHNRSGLTSTEGSSHGSESGSSVFSSVGRTHCGAPKGDGDAHRHHTFLRAGRTDADALRRFGARTILVYLMQVRHVPVATSALGNHLAARHSAKERHLW